MEWCTKIKQLLLNDEKHKQKEKKRRKTDWTVPEVDYNGYTLVALKLRNWLVFSLFECHWCVFCRWNACEIQMFSPGNYDKFRYHFKEYCKGLSLKAT